MSKYIVVPEKLIALAKKAKGKKYNEGLFQGLLLYSLVRIHQPKVVVEIGSQVGFSTCCLAMAMSDMFDLVPVNVGHVYGIEIMKAHANGTTKELENFGLSKFATILHGDSGEVIKSHNELHPIDFMFVDGDHSCDKVHKDVLDSFPFLSVGALVLFHDYNGHTKRGIDTALVALETKGGGFERIRLDILTNGLLIRKIK